MRDPHELAREVREAVDYIMANELTMAWRVGAGMSNPDVEPDSTVVTREVLAALVRTLGITEEMIDAADDYEYEGRDPRIIGVGPVLRALLLAAKEAPHE